MALLALQGPEARARLAGLVFINTPFINRRTRDFGPNGGRWLLGMFGLPTFAASVAAAKWWPSPVARWWLAGSLGVLGGIVMIFGELYLKKKRTEYAGSAPWTPEGVKAVILRTSADEASLALAAAQLASWVANRAARGLTSLGSLVEHSLFGGGTRLSRIVKGAFWWLVVYTLISFLLIYIFDKAGIPTAPIVFVVRWTAAVVFYTTQLALAAATLGPVALLLGWVAAAALSGIAGLAGPIETLLYDFAVDSTPVGTWEVHQVPPADSPRAEEAMRFGPIADPQLKAALALQHTSVHHDERALEVITQWLRMTRSASSP